VSAPSAPTAADKATATDAIAQNQSTSSDAVSDPSTAPAGHIPQIQDGTVATDASSPPEHAVTGTKAAAEGSEDACPACLGVLQAPEGRMQAVPSAMLAGLPEAEGNAGSWHTCTSGSIQTVSQCVR